MSRPRLLRVVDNVHMGLGHEGLIKLARRLSVPTELGQGELLMFLNRAKDKLKILGSEGRVVAYLKMPRGERIRLEALQYIPRTFSVTGRIDYNDALRQSLLNIMGSTRTVRRNAPVSVHGN